MSFCSAIGMRLCYSLDMQDEQITLRLPKVLALKAKQMAEAEGYGSLSDLVRDALRERIRRSVESALRDSGPQIRGAEIDEDEINKIVHEHRRERRTPQPTTGSQPAAKKVHA